MKKFFLLMLALILTFSLIACDGEEDGQNDDKEQSGDHSSAGISQSEAKTILDSITAENAEIRGECGPDAKWYFKDGTLAVKGTGEMTIGEDTTTILGDYYTEYREKVKRIVIEDGITLICERAFRNMIYNTAVYIPDSVTVIGDNAFANQTSLKSVALPGTLQKIGWQSFWYCNSLKTLTVPASVTEMDKSAFDDCAVLESVVVACELKINAFGGCPVLRTIDARHENNTVVDGVVFNKDKTVLVAYPAGREGSYVIPEGTVTVGEEAFDTCKFLTDITFPSTLRVIGIGAFENMKITSMVIPEGVTTIEENAFSFAKELQSVVIPESVTSIGKWAFAYSGLTSVTLPSSITEIPDSLFLYCQSLSSVTLPPNLTTIGDGAFNRCTALTTLALPATLTTIKGSAFYGCSGLSAITLPEGLQTIGTFVFNDCTALSELHVPAGVQEIGYSAFKNVPHVYYTGSATGNWGQTALN